MRTAFTSSGLTSVLQTMRMLRMGFSSALASSSRLLWKYPAMRS
jgi:hypothetical protein